MKRNKVIQFTPELISNHNYGLLIIVDNKSEITNNVDYACTVTYKLTYQHDKGGNKYGLCNILTDGWVYLVADSKEKLCEYLNNNPYDTKYRILTQEELLYLISNKTNINQLVQNLDTDCLLAH